MVSGGGGGGGDGRVVGGRGGVLVHVGGGSGGHGGGCRHAGGESRQLLTAEVFPESRPPVAEPHLHPRLGQLGSVGAGIRRGTELDNSNCCFRSLLINITI